MLFVAALPLWRTIVKSETIGPWEHIRAMAPFKEAQPEQPWDVLQADAALQFYPWRDLVFESWSKGQVPGWNPYVLGGTPLLANSQSGALYPPHILLGLLQVPTRPAISLLAWLHLAWAGLGLAVLVRRLGAGETGAAFAGISFALSAFMISWVSLASVPSTVSWIPWLLAGLAGLFDSCSYRKVGEVALAFGMMLLAGHLQFAAFGIMAAGVAICVLVFRRNFQALGLTALGLGIGALMAWPQVGAVIAFSKFSHRANVASEEGWTAYASAALQPADLLGVAHPYVFGDPRASSGVELMPVSQFYPALSRFGANFAEMAIPVGGLVLILSFFAVWKTRAVAVLGAIGALGLLIAFATPFAKLLYFTLPGWSSTGSPGRAIVLLVLALCGIAAFGADRLPTISKRMRSLAFAAFVVLLAIGIARFKAGTTDAWTDFVGPDRASALATTFLFGTLPLIGLALATTAAALSTARRDALCFGAVLLAVSGGALNLAMTGHPPKMARDMELNRVAYENPAWSLFDTPRANVPPNLNILSRTMTAGGYDSLMHRDTVTALTKLNNGSASPPENGNMIFVKPEASKEGLAEFGVTELVKLDGTRETLPGPGMVTGGRLDSIQPNAFRVEPEPGSTRVTLRDRNMPGWQAIADGHTVPIAEGFWKTVTIPKGTRSLEFRYVTPSLWPLILGLLGSLILVLRREA